MTDKEFLTEVLFKKMEKDEDNNIFNNYNNFSRDEFVFEQTVKHCLYFFTEILEENRRLQKGNSHFYQQMIKAQDELRKLKEASKITE